MSTQHTDQQSDCAHTRTQEGAVSGGCAAGRDPNAPAWGAVVGAPWWGALIRASAWLRGPCELCRAGGDRYGEAASASEAAKGLQDGSRGREAFLGRHRRKRADNGRNRIRKIGAPGEQRPSRCCRRLGVGSAPTTLRRTAARRLGRSPPGGRSARAVCKGGSGRPSERREAGGAQLWLWRQQSVARARFGRVWSGAGRCRGLAELCRRAGGAIACVGRGPGVHAPFWRPLLSSAPRSAPAQIHHGCPRVSYRS